MSGDHPPAETPSEPASGADGGADGVESGGDGGSGGVESGGDGGSGGVESGGDGGSGGAEEGRWSARWLSLLGILVFVASLVTYGWDLVTGHPVERSLAANAVAAVLLVAWAGLDSYRNPDSAVTTRGGAVGTGLVLVGIYLFVAGIVIAVTGLVHGRSLLGLGMIAVAIPVVIVGFLAFPTEGVLDADDTDNTEEGEDGENAEDGEDSEDAEFGAEEAGSEIDGGGRDEEPRSGIDAGAGLDGRETD